MQLPQIVLFLEFSPLYNLVHYRFLDQVGHGGRYFHVVRAHVKFKTLAIVQLHSSDWLID